MVLVVVLAFSVLRWNTSVYALTPGNGTPVAGLVTIKGVDTNPHPDRIMLTDVYLERLTVWGWLRAHFESHVQFVNADQLVEPGVSTEELDAQGFLQMNDAKRAAEVEAFRTIGWRVPVTNTGAVLTGIVTGAPAAAAGLHVGDEVVSVNGQTVRSGCELIRDVHDAAANTTLRLGVKKVTISKTGALSWRAATPVHLRTAIVPSGVTSSGCAGVSGRDHSWIGVSLENGLAATLPATVSINTSGIGGPSAGLAMTLTLINQLSAGSLTGHRVIAATGTMNLGGQVGDVGGVAEKTVAVQRAGATVFIVPQVEVKTARANAQPGLTILGVTTLQGALEDLRGLGGESPTPLTPPS